MENERFYSLIPLADFKAILGIDDREDPLSRYCLVTATYTIEQHCKRRLIRKKQTDYLTYTDEHIFTLKEYPIRKVLTVHLATTGTIQQGQALFDPASKVDPSQYYCLPDAGILEDIPFSLILRPPLRLPREEKAIRVQYLSGYAPEGYPPYGTPADLGSACLELAAWNLTRYRTRRIGITGMVRGKQSDGEHLEPSMPEHVRELLEPYRRRTI
jgi:hypothetical protein